MNTDFRVAVSFVKHPKTKLLRANLGPGAVEHLMRLWTYIAVNCPEGRIRGMSPQDLSDEAMWKGDPATFVDALLATPVGYTFGFFERDGDDLVAHDWKEHNGYASGAELRVRAARVAGKASARKRLERSLNARSQRFSTTVQRPVERPVQPPPSPTPSPSPSPSPSPTPTPPPLTPSPKSVADPTTDLPAEVAKRVGGVLNSFLEAEPEYAGDRDALLALAMHYCREAGTPEIVQDVFGEVLGRCRSDDPPHVIVGYSRHIFDRHLARHRDLQEKQRRIDQEREKRLRDHAEWERTQASPEVKKRAIAEARARLEESGGTEKQDLATSARSDG